MGVVIWKLFYPFRTQSLYQQLAAKILRLGMRQRLEVMADLGACAPSAHETQPGRIGAGHGRSDDFHHIAIFQLGAQRCLLPIDARRHGAVAHIAVDGVGKVDYRRAARQRQDPAFGRKHIHRIGEQVYLDVVPEFGGVAGFVLDVEQRLQPLVAEPVRPRSIRIFCLVQPMRRHAGFCHQVHRFGAQLELDVDTRRPHQRGVE